MKKNKNIQSTSAAKFDALTNKKRNVTQVAKPLITVLRHQISF